MIAPRLATPGQEVDGRRALELRALELDRASRLEQLFDRAAQLAPEALALGVDAAVPNDGGHAVPGAVDGDLQGADRAADRRAPVCRWQLGDRDPEQVLEAGAGRRAIEPEEPGRGGVPLPELQSSVEVEHGVGEVRDQGWKMRLVDRRNGGAPIGQEAQARQLCADQGGEADEQLEARATVQQEGDGTECADETDEGDSRPGGAEGGDDPQRGRRGERHGRHGRHPRRARRDDLDDCQRLRHEERRGGEHDAIATSVDQRIEPIADGRHEQQHGGAEQRDRHRRGACQHPDRSSGDDRRRTGAGERAERPPAEARHEAGERGGGRRERQRGERRDRDPAKAGRLEVDGREPADDGQHGDRQPRGEQREPGAGDAQRARSDHGGESVVPARRAAMVRTPRPRVAAYTRPE
jgi:hypothetical protein